jgi:hypothetical protein
MYINKHIKYHDRQAEMSLSKIYPFIQFIAHMFHQKPWNLECEHLIGIRNCILSKKLNLTTLVYMNRPKELTHQKFEKSNSMDYKNAFGSLLQKYRNSAQLLNIPR